MGGIAGLLLALPLVIKSVLHQFGFDEGCAGQVVDGLATAAAALGVPLLAVSKPVIKKEVK